MMPPELVALLGLAAMFIVWNITMSKMKAVAKTLSFLAVTMGLLATVFILFKP